MDNVTWQDVFKVIIMLFVAAAGAPFTQWVKIGLSKLFKKVIEDRFALILTLVVSIGFAIIEMVLSGVLKFSDITIGNFPAAFFGVFSVATIYFAWLKNSPSFFGEGGLLKKPE